MARSCRAGQHWDSLLKKCISCDPTCKRQPVVARCASYCESAYCKALPGHYYDLLLKKCVRCAEVCGQHPAVCSRHCQTPTPPATTKTLLIEVTSRGLDPSGLSALTAVEDSSVLLYSLLALCMTLLFSSLSLALAVLLRAARAKSSRQEPEEANHHQERVVQKWQEVANLGKISKDFRTKSNHNTDFEPAYDSSPTETCACVHCFPDLKALGQGNDGPPRPPFPVYRQPVLHRAQIQVGGPVWAEENLHTFGLQVQEEAAVG